MDKTLDTTFLHDAARMTGLSHKSDFLDYIACELHNRGYELDGNTEESDVSWFARRLWQEFGCIRLGSPNGVSIDNETFAAAGLVPNRYWTHKPRWDCLTEEEQSGWRLLATATLKVLPHLQRRIAHRLIAVSQNVRLLARAAAAECKAEAEKQGRAPA